jgi:hypothetical protein
MRARVNGEMVRQVALRAGEIGEPVNAVPLSFGRIERDVAAVDHASIYAEAEHRAAHVSTARAGCIMKAPPCKTRSTCKAFDARKPTT